MKVFEDTRLSQRPVWRPNLIFMSIYCVCVSFCSYYLFECRFGRTSDPKSHVDLVIIFQVMFSNIFWLVLEVRQKLPTLFWLVISSSLGMLAFRRIHEEFNQTIEICRVSLGRGAGSSPGLHLRVGFGNILGASGYPNPAKRQPQSRNPKGWKTCCRTFQLALGGGALNTGQFYTPGGPQ